MNHTKGWIVCSLALGLVGWGAHAAEATTPPVTETVKPVMKAKVKKAPKKKAKTQDTVKSTASAPTSAATFDGFDSANADYSTTAVERPLILPKGLKQASVSVNMDRTSVGETTTGWATDFAFETGLGNRIQVGGVIETTMSPEADFGFFLGNAQYGIHEMANARLDFGFVQTPGSDMNFTFGIGAPVKYRLTPATALIGGRSDTMAAISGSNQTDAIFTLTDSKNGSVKSLGMPVGIEHSFNAMISGRARTGYRAVFATGKTTSFIPLNVDAQVTPVRNIDVVATAGFDGAISSGLGYTDFFNASLMGRFRF